MKKTVMSIFISLSAVLLVASFAFAGTHGENYTYDAETPIDLDNGATINLQPSPGVAYDYSANGTGQSCHMAAANEKGTKAYAGTSDFEGMMVTINDYSGDEVAFPAMPDEGTAWDGAVWMVMGDPNADVPGS